MRKIGIKISESGALGAENMKIGPYRLSNRTEKNVREKWRHYFESDKKFCPTKKKVQNGLRLKFAIILFDIVFSDKVVGIRLKKSLNQ